MATGNVSPQAHARPSQPPTTMGAMRETVIEWAGEYYTPEEWEDFVEAQTDDLREDTWNMLTP